MATQPPGTGLAIFDPKAAVPAHIANFFEAEGTNIQPRGTVPSLSPEGKTWTISIDGQKTKLQGRNADGDMYPLPIMKVVILDYAKQRGRAYYEGDYDPANVSAPVCWSDDGEKPSDSLPGPYNPQQLIDLKIEKGASRKISEKCATCPMAVKGSKTTPQGKAVTACAQHLMVAVLPDPTMGLPAPLQKPLRLKLAITSVWDKQSPDQEQQGWLAFDNYVQWIVSRGVKHTAAVVTKMKFDPEAAYPKIFFSAERHLDAAELALVAPLLHDEEVKKLLGGTWTPAGVDGVTLDQQHVAAPQTTGQPETTEQPPVVAAAAPPPAQPPVEQGKTLPPAGYQMNPTEAHTYEAYVAGGWTDDQLIANGKLVAVQAPPPAEPVVATPAPPPAPAAATAEVVVVGDQPVAAAAPTPSTSAQPVAEAVVVATPVAQPAAAAPSSPAVSAPAAVVVQEPAQATAPAPVPTPQAPEPPAAAAAAAEVTPPVSTTVPGDVAALLDEWK